MKRTKDWDLKLLDIIGVVVLIGIIVAFYQPVKRSFFASYDFEDGIWLGFTSFLWCRCVMMAKIIVLKRRKHHV